MRAFLVSLFMLLSLTLAIVAAADASAHTSGMLPSVARVLPDTLPVNLEAAGTLPRHEAARLAPAPEAARVWTCGAPRGLASDASATVRVCEYR